MAGESESVLSLRYLFSRRRSHIAYALNIALASTALLDFCSSMAVRHVETGTSSTLISWLQENASRVGILFSLLWFFDAFVWANRSRLKAIHNLDKKRLSLSQDEADVEWLKCHDVYIRTMTLQILLLPVGFIDPLLRFVFGEGSHTSYDEINSGVPTARATVSLGFAVTQYFFMIAARLVDSHWASFRLTRVRRLKRLLIIYVVRHPFRFRRRLRRWLRAFRWIKQLAPLIGSFNKLRGNLTGLTKKYTQYRRTRGAKNLRVLRRKQLSDSELKDHCAILIQKSYRAHSARKKLYLVNLMAAKEAVLAAMNLQKQLRDWMLRAKARLRHDWQELKRLHALPRLEMSPDQRRRMYFLQTELQKETDYLLNKKLLLRPNTRFLVAWKLLFVVAVIFEVTILVCKPFTAHPIDPLADHPVAVETAILERFLPEPLSVSPVCNPKPPKPRRNILTRLFRSGKEEIKTRAIPWYCNRTVVRVQGAFVESSRLLVQRIVNIFWFISFLDVFVVFFTGSYDNVSGNLEPAPFVRRWIVPGLCFQLLVNDKVEKVYSIVRKMIEGLLHHGPNRVLRWTIALFFPLGLFVRDQARHMAYRYISEQNRRLAEQQLFSGYEKSRDVLVIRSSRRGSSHLRVLRTTRPSSQVFLRRVSNSSIVVENKHGSCRW